MRSALIIHSPSTKLYADNLRQQFEKEQTYFPIETMEFKGALTTDREELKKIVSRETQVHGIGGGTIIDLAKILAGENRCIAIPTTAAGSAVTSHAVIWGDIKHSIKTQKPVLALPQQYYGLAKTLSLGQIGDTFADCLCHTVESRWSKRTTKESLGCANHALSLLGRYHKKHNVNNLIEAGNAAGRAIEITGTNLIHAISYPLTIRCRLPHGKACLYALCKVVRYMKKEGAEYLFSELPREYLFSKLPNIENLSYHFGVEQIASEAMIYKQIHDCPYEVNKEILVDILTEN